MSKSIWIDLVQVLSLPGSELLQDVSGAYVNVLTWASSSHEFREKAKELMNCLGLKLVTVEEVEPLSRRQEKGSLGPEIVQVAAKLEGSPASIRYLAFHTWKEVNA